MKSGQDIAVQQPTLSRDETFDVLTTSLANENRSPIEIMERIKIASMPSQATTIYRVSLLWKFSFVIPTGMLSTQRRRIV